MEQLIIPTFITNLAKRKVRKKHSQKMFEDKHEFDVRFVESIEHEIGVVGHWLTIQYIFENCVSNENFVLICEDDHCFTERYDKESFFNTIRQAKYLEADFLLGGVTWFDYSLQISSDLFWVNNFTGLQFVVVFQKFFNRILNSDFHSYDIACDFKFASLSESKLLIHPFISIQKEFGQSDVTPRNATSGYLTKITGESSDKLFQLRKVQEFYGLDFNEVHRLDTCRLNDYFENQQNNISITTYFLETERNKRGGLDALEKKSEFNLKVIEFSKIENDIDKQWAQIQIAINRSLIDQDDVIIFCDSGLVFSEEYSANRLLLEIINANQLGVGLLIGGASTVNHVVPITQSLCWVDIFTGANFFIVYKNLFQQVLLESVGNAISLSEIMSSITSNKMIIYPPFSISSLRLQHKQTDSNVPVQLIPAKDKIRKVNNIKNNIIQLKENLLKTQNIHIV